MDKSGNRGGIYRRDDQGDEGRNRKIPDKSYAGRAVRRRVLGGYQEHSESHFGYRECSGVFQFVLTTGEGGTVDSETEDKEEG